MRLRTWTLRRRALALCVVVGLMLTGLAVAAGLTAVSNNQQLDDLLNRIGPMRVAGERLITAMVDQETGIRGYALSGDVANLAPYNSGLQSQETQTALIAGNLNSGSRDGAIRTDLLDVQSRIAQWHTSIADPVLAAVRAHGTSGARNIVDAASTTQFDALRASVSAMQDDIQSLRDVSTQAVKQSSQAMVGIQITAAVVVMLAGAALLLGLDRLITRPVLDLATQVREVASGDYEKNLAGGRSPELAALADDVDGMRRKIAAELTKVRQARLEVEQSNSRLEARTDELTRSNRDLEQFAYVASHDLQEPLRKVASFCQLLQRRYAGRLDERADQYIAFAVDGAQRMQRLINDLLAFSRIGRLTAGFAEIDLNHVLSEATSQLEMRAGEDSEITWSQLPIVAGEEPLLTTLFVNLVGNSLKFRRPEEPPRIRITAERLGDDWQITVRDNGIGIESEFADKVFVIFQRLHARDVYEGTGIGLAIVKKIVEYHGGRIWLDLAVEQGASVNFTLPAAVSTPPAIVRQGPASEATE